MTKSTILSSHVGKNFICTCCSCNTKTNHTIVADIEQQIRDEYEYTFYGSDKEYQIIQCDGCDTISFRSAHYSTENVYHIEGEEREFKDTFLIAENFYPNTNSIGLSSKALLKAIKDKNIPSIEAEFSRATKKINLEPRESISAACNILESIFKVYISDENLDEPKKKDIKSLWNTVRKDLGYDTRNEQDEDLNKIISGMISVIDGVGSLRTHSSTAHGAGRMINNIESRHARLANHAAHTIGLFILESWDEKMIRTTNTRHSIKLD